MQVLCNSLQPQRISLTTYHQTDERVSIAPCSRHVERLPQLKPAQRNSATVPDVATHECKRKAAQTLGGYDCFLTALKNTHFFSF
jgi:hypothetical protein